MHHASLADALAAMHAMRCGARRGFDGGGWTAELGAGGIRAATEAVDLPGLGTSGRVLPWFWWEMATEQHLRKGL